MRIVCERRRWNKNCRGRALVKRMKKGQTKAKRAGGGTERAVERTEATKESESLRRDPETFRVCKIERVCGAVYI